MADHPGGQALIVLPGDPDATMIQSKADFDETDRVPVTGIQLADGVTDTQLISVQVMDLQGFSGNGQRNCDSGFRQAIAGIENVRRQSVSCKSSGKPAAYFS